MARSYCGEVTPNVSYALLDAAIIAGRGEEPAVMSGERTWSHARLLEEVAALGGVLRHLGIRVGVPCVIDLEPGPAKDLDAVVAALATARLGGVVTTEDDASAPVVLVAPAPRCPPTGGLGWCAASPGARSRSRTSTGW